MRRQMLGSVLVLLVLVLAPRPARADHGWATTDIGLGDGLSVGIGVGVALGGVLALTFVVADVVFATEGRLAPPEWAWPQLVYWMGTAVASAIGPVMELGGRGPLNPLAWTFGSLGVAASLALIVYSIVALVEGHRSRPPPASVDGAGLVLRFH